MSATSKPVRRYALLFELEHAVFDARAAMFEAARSALSERDAELTAVLFRKHCLHGSPRTFMAELFKALGKKTSPERAASEAETKYRKSLSRKAVDRKNPVAAFVNSALAAKMSCAALSFLDEPLASQLLENAGWSGKVSLCSFAGRATFDTALWKDAAQRLDIPPHRCAAITTDSASCLGAVAAGMFCLARPDEHTEFQNCSGADVFWAEDAVVSAGKVLKLLEK